VPLDRNGLTLSAYPLDFGVWRVDAPTDTLCFNGSSLPPIDAAHRLHAERMPYSCRVPEKIGATLMGIAFSPAIVCRPCACNVRHALHTRHLAARPPATRAFFWSTPIIESFLPEVTQRYRAMVVNYDKWILKWPEAKRRQITLSERQDPVVPGKVKVMLKREHVRSSRRGRLIQFYKTLATQSRFGRELFFLQHAYSQMLYRYEVAPGLRLTFACGMNSTQLGKWMEEVMAAVKNPRFYERDCRSWDATVNHEMHKVKIAAYNVGIPGLTEFINACEKVVGKWSDGVSFIRYTSNGCTKSGHNDTTLGNSLMNAAITIEAAIHFGIRGEIIVCGDDMLFVTEGPIDAAAFAAYEASFGVLPEYKVWEHVEQCSFISGLWVPNGSGYSFVPKLGRLLGRLMWTTNPPSRKKEGDYMFSVVEGMRIFHETPIVRALLRTHWRPGKLMETGRSRVYRGAQPAPLNWTWIANRYSLGRQECLEVERLIYSVGRQRVVIRHPVVDRMIAVDYGE
jgi:hypothetical protein